MGAGESKAAVDVAATDAAHVLFVVAATATNVGVVVAVVMLSEFIVVLYTFLRVGARKKGEVLQNFSIMKSVVELFLRFSL